MTESQPSAPLATSLSLSEQLVDVAHCVQAVEQGRSLSDVLPRVAASRRPGVQALAFLVLRRLGTARALTRCLARRAPPAPVQALLHTALALLLSAQEGEEGGRYAEHTLVDQAIEAAKSGRDTRMQAGFINACLRRYLRERDALRAQADKDPEAVWNHPRWWIERVRRDHPEHWQQILQAASRPAPMVLRVNRRRTTRDAYREQLAQAGAGAQALGDDGLVLQTPQPVERLPGFAQGLCSVQDGAAQLAAALLLDGRSWPVGARVLDACAAPGGKTAHLLERADLDLLALDADADRCRRIDENLLRLGLKADVRCADAGVPSGWWDGRPFDAILLDAPCTASGIVRRHPDVRWLRRESDVTQLAAAQRRLLEALWPLLRPGGRLVYCTCSVFKAEGQEQVRAFLEHHTDALALPSVGHLMPGNGAASREFNDNRPGGYDGFFYACLEKAGL